MPISTDLSSILKMSHLKLKADILDVQKGGQKKYLNETIKHIILNYPSKARYGFIYERMSFDDNTKK